MIEISIDRSRSLVYSVPLLETGDYFKRLRARWLPYYNERLRKERLAGVREFCLNNLGHIPLYVDRGLYFQAFDRLYNAFRVPSSSFPFAPNLSRCL